MLFFRKYEYLLYKLSETCGCRLSLGRIGLASAALAEKLLSTKTVANTIRSFRFTNKSRLDFFVIIRPFYSCKPSLIFDIKDWVEFG